MSPTHSTAAAATIVALAYLAETLYGPVVGQIAQAFGQSDVAGYAYISVAFYGSAVSGLFILALANRWHLERCISAGLVLAPALNLLSLAVGTWELALALRFGAGICSGVVVGALVISFAHTSSGDRLARDLSMAFSFAFLALVPAMAMVPHIVAKLGPTAPGHLHLLLCVGVAVAVSGNTFTPHRGAGGVLRGVMRTFPRIFWSRGKCLAFGLHTISLFGAYLVLFGIQPALTSAGIADHRIGLALAVLSGTTCAGGLVHAWMTRGVGLPGARWTLIAWGTGAVIAASACMAMGGQAHVFAAVVLLAGLGIFGGPPTFEALLYDLGPVDAVASGLQRCLIMSAATILSTTVLALAVWSGLKIVMVLILALSAAYTAKSICYLLVRRMPEAHADGCGAQSPAEVLPDPST